MPPISPSELARLRALADAATPGPWPNWADDDLRSQLRDDLDLIMPVVPESDCEFIAASRTALPALLDEVERLHVLRNGAGRLAKQVVALEAESAALRSRVEELERALEEIETAWGAMRFPDDGDELAGAIERARRGAAGERKP